MSMGIQEHLHFNVHDKDTACWYVAITYVNLPAMCVGTEMLSVHPKMATGIF